MEPVPLLSACLIVRNEASNLPRCLASLSGLADEIVVIDTGSTDDTPRIAAGFGAKVHHQLWQNDFSLHRNAAIERATGKWIYSIDADEEVVETDFAETRYHLEHSTLPPVLLVKEAVLYPGGIEKTLVLPRLFQREAGFRYVHPIHEQLDAVGSMAALCNIRVLHHGYVAPGALQAKEVRNLEIATLMPDSLHAHHCRARAAFSLEKWSVVVEATERLAQDAVAPSVAAEACVLGATAALRLGDLELARWFGVLAQRRAPGSQEAKQIAELISAQSLSNSPDAEQASDGSAIPRTRKSPGKGAPVLETMESRFELGRGAGVQDGNHYDSAAGSPPFDQGAAGMLYCRHTKEG